MPDSGLLPIGAVSAHTMHWLLTPQFVQQPCSSRIVCTSSPPPGAPGADSSFHPALGHHTRPTIQQQHATTAICISPWSPCVQQQVHHVAVPSAGLLTARKRSGAAYTLECRSSFVGMQGHGTKVPAAGWCCIFCCPTSAEGCMVCCHKGLLLQILHAARCTPAPAAAAGASYPVYVHENK